MSDSIKRFLSFVRSLHQRHAKGLSSLWNGMAMLGKKTSEREQKTPGERRLGSGRKEKERLTAAQTVKPERILGQHLSFLSLGLFTFSYKISLYQMQDSIDR